MRFRQANKQKIGLRRLSMWGKRGKILNALNAMTKPAKRGTFFKEVSRFLPRMHRGNDVAVHVLLED